MTTQHLNREVEAAVAERAGVKPAPDNSDRVDPKKGIKWGEGRSRTATYRSWDAARARCFNTRHQAYGRYGGRGITICDRWRAYENFLADMGERPEGTSLDRIDNDKGYEPGNCRWATRQEQNSNRRYVRVLAWDGREQTVAAWARELGFDYCTLVSRIDAGWPLDRAFTTPTRRRGH